MSTQTVTLSAVFDDVSRETRERLQAYVRLLLKWNQAYNLIGRATEAEIWSRHIEDAAQLWPLIKGMQGPLLDIGTGAGLPGVVLAILGVPEVHLVEKSRKKATFLSQVQRDLGLSVHIHGQRLEDMAPFPAAIITARAFAPVSEILALGAPFCGPETAYLLLKGESWQEELAEAAKVWQFNQQNYPSLTHPKGQILRLTNIIYRG